MAVDRTFTVAGHGTVVTGSVSSGRARLGDELTIEPAGIKVRVRGLHNHDAEVEVVQRGQRAAMNLAGVHHDQIDRGQEVCSVGHLKASRLLSVELSLLNSAPRPLKTRSRQRVHVGTAELLASVRLVSGEQLQPGETGFAQLYLQQPAAAVWSQPFVLRSESPVVTIGGGRILDPDAAPIRRPTPEQLEMLQHLGSQEPVARASASLFFAGFRDWDAPDLVRAAGIGAYQATFATLLERRLVREIELSPSRALRIHERVFQQLGDRIASVLDQLHTAHPLRTSLERTALDQRFRYLPHPAVLEAALAELKIQQRVVLGARTVALAGRGPQLSQNETKAAEQAGGRIPHRRL